MLTPPFLPYSVCTYQMSHCTPPTSTSKTVIKNRKARLSYCLHPALSRFKPVAGAAPRTPGLSTQETMCPYLGSRRPSQMQPPWTGEQGLGVFLLARPRVRLFWNLLSQGNLFPSDQRTLPGAQTHVREPSRAGTTSSMGDRVIPTCVTHEDVPVWSHP